MSRNPTHKRGAQEPQDRDSKSDTGSQIPVPYGLWRKPESGC